MRLCLFIILFCASLEAAMTPEEGLKRLKAGNQRFVNEELLHPNRSGERRSSLVESQLPFAVIVTCSDSRVVPEVIFDEGLGDLFVIRVAGNVVGATEIESIQYAIDHLHPVVVVVMGHENCGAVDAVLTGQTGDIPVIATLVEPAVEAAHNAKEPLKRSIELNALNMQKLLLNSPLVKEQIQKKSIAVHAAYYNMQTGKVEFLDSVRRS